MRPLLRLHNELELASLYTSGGAGGLPRCDIRTVGKNAYDSGTNGLAVKDQSGQLHAAGRSIQIDFREPKNGRFVEPDLNLWGGGSIH